MKTAVNNNLVSIIIPCFNSEKYIEETFYSAINQDYMFVEVILVDDGSTDRTMEILKALEKKYPEKVRVLKNKGKGAPSARNVGLSFSLGGYIHFLDSDDILLPGKISVQMNVFKKWPSAGAVVSSRQVRNDSLSKVLEEIHFHDLEDDPLNTCINKVIATDNPIYKREWVEIIGGYREDLPCAQDWDFHIRLVAKGVEFAYIDDMLLATRKVNNSLSSDWKKVGIQMCKLINEYESWLLHDERMNYYSRKKFATILYMSALASEDKDEAVNLVDKALKWVQGDLSFVGHPIKIFIARLIGVHALLRLQKKVKKYA